MVKHEIGSVVSIDTMRLFEDREEDLMMMAYTPRPKCYGIVKDNRMRYHYSVHWAISGLFNLDDDRLSELNCQSYYHTHIKGVKNKDDDEVDDDTYLMKYFEHNGDKWKLKPCDVSCTRCEEPRVQEVIDLDSDTEEEQLPPRSPRRHCQCLNWKVALPMEQLYHDLSQDYNGDKTNRQKRFICYRWYTRVRHGVLLARDRRRVCPCVEIEIGEHFPETVEEPRVGFIAV